jgi:phosphohistidine phosphatase
MIVFLVRHGEALPEEKDPSRPLTEKGRAEVEAAAQALKAEVAVIDEIWHSSKLRAKQTAEIIASVLNIKNVIEKEGLKPNDPVAPIAELIRRSNKTLLLAGHLPFLSKLASFLKTGLEDDEAVEFRSGGVVRVDI